MSSRDKILNSRTTLGPLCSHLAETSTIISAIEHLRNNSANYTFVITRSLIDRESGELQNSNITIGESDTDELAKLPATLPRSKNIQICFRTSDQGLARIDLTARRWWIWVDTPAVREILSQFNKTIHSGRKARAATLGVATLLVLWPFIMTAILTIVDAAINPGLKSSDGTNVPQWINHLGTILAPYPFYLWILTVIGALVIGIVRLQGGGMRKWPERFSKKALIIAFYQFRINPLNRESTRTVVVGVISSVVTAVILAVFIGKK